MNAREAMKLSLQVIIFFDIIQLHFNLMYKLSSERHPRSLLHLDFAFLGSCGHCPCTPPQTGRNSNLPECNSPVWSIAPSFPITLSLSRCPCKLRFREEEAGQAS